MEMTNLPIITVSDLAALSCKDHALRAECRPFVFGVDEIAPIAEALRAAIRAHDIAVGFAAPQLGLDRRVVIINHKKKTLENERVLVNPILLDVGLELVEKFESCMSIPGWRGRLARASYVKVGYLDEAGAEHVMEAEGFLARILAHEIDHLNGVLYTDRLPSLDILERVDDNK